MRACWAATLLVLAQPSPASCATCRGTAVVPQVLALTHRRLHKSPCVRQPFVETSGSIAFSSLCSFPENCALFLCASSRVHSTTFPACNASHRRQCIASSPTTPYLDPERGVDSSWITSALPIITGQMSVLVFQLRTGGWPAKVCATTVPMERIVLRVEHYDFVTACVRTSRRRRAHGVSTFPMAFE